MKYNQDQLRCDLHLWFVVRGDNSQKIMSIRLIQGYGLQGWFSANELPRCKQRGIKSDKLPFHFTASGGELDPKRLNADLHADNVEKITVPELNG